MSPGYRKSGKRILYMLYKKTNVKLRGFREGFCKNNEEFNDKNRYKKQDDVSLHILRNFKKKGLVGMTEYLDGNIYWLTEEGRKVAKPIVEEIDEMIAEYKRWQ